MALTYNFFPKFLVPHSVSQPFREPVWDGSSIRRPPLLADSGVTPYIAETVYPSCRVKSKAMTNPNYRVDFVLVEATQTALTQMQSKINQWVTKGELKKYKSSVVGNAVLFEIVRLKGGE